jgi:hypothetical protein
MTAMVHLRNAALVVLLLCVPALAADAPAAKAPDQAPDTADLRPRFVAGRTARYDVWTLRDQQSTIKAGADTRSFGSRLEVRGQITWRVERVRPDGSATCVMTMDYLTADLTPSDGPMQHNDTRQSKGDSDTLHTLLRAMAGVPVRCEVAADGSIDKVAGTDGVRRKLPADVDAPDDLDYVETAADLATICGAPAATGLGAAWNQDFIWNHEVGRLHQAMRYTLAGVEEIAGIPVATVNGTAKLKIEVDRSKLPADAQVDVRLTAGDLTTQVMFDLQRHEAVGRNSYETRQIEAKIRAGDQSLIRVLNETIQSQALRIAEE